MLQSEPLKTGFEVLEEDGIPSDLPVRLRFPNGSITKTQSNELSVDFIGGSLPSTYLAVDQITNTQVVSGRLRIGNASTYFELGGSTLSLYVNGVLVQSWTVTLVDNSHILGINLSLGGLW